MEIGQAVSALRCGNRVARRGWNGKSQYLELRIPDDHSKMTLPYIYIKTVQDDLVPWLASQTDILAIDWEIVAVNEVDQDRVQAEVAPSPSPDLHDAILLNKERADLMRQLLDVGYTFYQASCLSDLPVPNNPNKIKEGY